MGYHEIMKEARERAGLTQKEAAEKLQISQQRYSEYETGKRAFPIKKIEMVCHLFHTTPNELFSWKEDKNEAEKEKNK